MKFKFSDIENNLMYDTARVMVVTGPYSIFNNIVSDKLRTMCKGDLEINENTELMAEFNLSSFSNNNSANSIDFVTFMEVAKMPAVTGKWYCSVDYKMLTKKHREILERYMKKPSENGVLTVIINDYMDYKSFLRNRVISGHQNTHLIQLRYPYRSILMELVRKMISGRGLKVSNKAIELFVMRMSSSYDEYEQVIDNICTQVGSGEITYENMIEALKEVYNYVLDDFINELVHPIKVRKIVITRKVYKMINALVKELGAKAIIDKLRYRIEDMIEMRMIINAGIVPVTIKYSLVETRNRMPEEHRLKKLSDFSFRKCAQIASQTSLRDWVFMKLIINNIKTKWNEEEYEKALHALVHRAVMSESRILNDIGVINTIDEQLYYVNSALFKGGL